MSVRPNIQSMVLNGTELTVFGESEDDPNLAGIFVVVTQDDAAGAARLTRPGIGNRAAAGWSRSHAPAQGHRDRSRCCGRSVHPW